MFRCGAEDLRPDRGPPGDPHRPAAKNQSCRIGELNMPFVISKFLEHGTSNPIVARLSLQTMRILEQCKIAQETRDKITEIYVHSLQKKLIRCWEIEERFRSEFKSAVESYKPPSSGSQFVQLPQIPRLDEECHNFLYEMKNYVRDLLNVFNRLYGTDFKEASEFFQAKKDSKSLIEFAAWRRWSRKLNAW